MWNQRSMITISVWMITLSEYLLAETEERKWILIWLSSTHCRTASAPCSHTPTSSALVLIPTLGKMIQHFFQGATRTMKWIDYFIRECCSLYCRPVFKLIDCLHFCIEMFIDPKLGKMTHHFVLFCQRL